MTSYTNLGPHLGSTGRLLYGLVSVVGTNLLMLTCQDTVGPRSRPPNPTFQRAGQLLDSFAHTFVQAAVEFILPLDYCDSPVTVREREGQPAATATAVAVVLVHGNHRLPTLLFSPFTASFTAFSLPTLFRSHSFLTYQKP